MEEVAVRYLSTHEIEEILRGCEGVTLGPWAYEQAGPGMADMRLYSDLGGEHRHSVVVALIAPQKHDNDAKHIARLDPATVKALATELLNRRSVTSQASEGEVEMIEAMIAGTAPMSKWMASVDYSTYDGFEEYLKAQLREKLMLKATLDPNRKNGEKEENLATFVDAGVGALEGALATYRVVRRRVAAPPSQPAAVGELLTRAETAARIMMEYDAWEVPAPAPADPIDYAWTAQVINDLAAALVHRDQVKL